MVKEVMKELVVAAVVTAINFLRAGHCETIYDIEPNTDKSVKFFKYFGSACILLPVLYRH
jgi:uncharacterized membrane protein YhdT